MKKEPTQKTVYCTCGEQVTMKGKNLDDAIEMWRTWNLHRGEGHAPCDRKTAMLARKKWGKVTQ